VNARFTGRVTNITDYGAFVELEPGIEGLIHVSEMSWTKKNMHPGKIVSTSQEVEVQVLEVDSVKRRISLGLKQTMRNPGKFSSKKFPVGSTVEGEVKNKNRSLAFSLAWKAMSTAWSICRLDWKASGRAGDRQLQEGRRGESRGARRRFEKERISLGVKQLEGESLRRAGRRQEGRGRDLRSARSQGIRDRGEDRRYDFTTFIKRSELARDRNDQRAERFAVGEKVDARVIQLTKKARKVQVRSSAGSRRREGGHRAVWLLDSERRWATSSAPRSRTRQVSIRFLL